MRIGNDVPTKGRRNERNVLAILMLVLASMSVLLLWAPTPSSSSQVIGEQTLFCGAEIQEGEHFTHNNQAFAGVTYRTGEQVRSGRYAIRFPADDASHFAFTTTIDASLPGTLYEVSVWSYGNENQGAKLAVQGREPQGFYLDTAEPTQRDAQGWTEHRLRFHVPFQNTPQELAFYVYSTGEEVVYFDDLRIERIDQIGETFVPTRIELQFSESAWDKLKSKRDAALKAGLLQTADDDWVDAQLTDDQQTQDIKVRLKGDWLDHLRGNKWSFRVKMKGSGAWRGLRIFSLHSPAARYFLHEWLLHQFWREQDVLTPRYDFVELVVNGESRGIYAYEEHFAKQLVESQSRREGPVVKFSEEGYWAGIARQLDHLGFVSSRSSITAQRPANAPVTAFQQSTLEQDSTLNRLWQQARLRMEAFRNGSLSTTELFDLKRLCAYYAGADLFNAYHGIVWHNQRFYYNPITTQLEPIGFDGFAQTPSLRFHFLAEGGLHREAPESMSLPAYFLSDSVFMTEYLRTLEQLTQPEQWQAFIDQYTPGWLARAEWLNSEFPEYRAEITDFTQEAAFVRAHLLPFRENALRTELLPDGDMLVSNTHGLPVVLQGYGQSARGMTSPLIQPKWLPTGPVRNLYERLEKTSSALPFQSIRFSDQQALAFQETSQQVRMPRPPANAQYAYITLPGWDTLLSVPLTLVPQPSTLLLDGLATLQNSIAVDFPDLRWDDINQIVEIPAGQHTFRQDLIVPVGYQLLLAAGADVDLQQQAAIICRGPVQAFGEDERPVFIHSSDGTGQGLQVLQSPIASVLRHTVFQKLRPLEKGDWRLTGAVTFYESAVQIMNCKFLDNQSEDALNLVRSEFQMQYTLIQNTSSDGFDADFCKGRISHSSFVRTANDGVDCSGSIITLDHVHMEHCGDKGVSAGEASDLTLKNATISHCVIGLASKDQSTLHAKSLQISDCQQGLVAFQKKPEYGPAFLLIEGLTAENNQRLYQIAPGSRLQIDDKIVGQSE